MPKPPGQGSRFKVPCQVHIFAKYEAFERIKMTIARGGLQLITQSSASFTLSESMAVKETKGNQRKSVDEIFKLLESKLNDEGAVEALEPPKTVIKSELFSHQKKGLGWLVRRENSSKLPPFWEEIDDMYVNTLTNFQTVTKPDSIRGGIFADDMGLGKTLTLLSLIAYDMWVSSGPSSDNGIRDEEDDEKNIPLLGRKSTRGRVSRKAENAKKKQKIDDLNYEKGKSCMKIDGFSSRATLIVCPPAVFSSWVTQLEEHTVAGSFKVYIYYGERTKDAEVLQKYDIVLTTYSTLASEETEQDSPIKKIEWRRVILDEAHVIKNVNAQQSRAVTNLKAKLRWAVTGTPIQNNSFDLFSLMSFLKFEPFCIKSLWNSLIQYPLSQGDEKGISRLQVSPLSDCIFLFLLPDTRGDCLQLKF